MKIAIYDTETTGFIKPDGAVSDQPYMVQLGLLICDENGIDLDSFQCIIAPTGWEVPERVAEIHGITTTRAMEEGIPLVEAISKFLEMIADCDLMVAHNIDFDRKVLWASILRADAHEEGAIMKHMELPQFCTMKEATDIVRIPKMRGGKEIGGFKWPKLMESHIHFFGEGFEGEHTAMGDVQACKKIYFAVKKAREELSN